MVIYYCWNDYFFENSLEKVCKFPACHIYKQTLSWINFTIFQYSVTFIPTWDFKWAQGMTSDSSHDHVNISSETNKQISFLCHRIIYFAIAKQKDLVYVSRISFCNGDLMCSWHIPFPFDEGRHSSQLWKKRPHFNSSYN